MAIMIPSDWADKNASHAERLVWHLLRDHTPGDWLAIHSLGLASHSRKPWAEADFVVICGDGVIVLEVKGGRVSVENGRWTTNGKPLNESPFGQAGGAAAAIHSELRDRFPVLRRAIVGWGVVLPDVTFDREGPGILPAVVYDDRDLPTEMADYIHRVGTHWRAYHRLDGDAFRPLSRGERAAIARYLNPTFDLVPTLRSQVARSEEQLARLTRQQGRVMRGLRMKERVIVRGGAGTGKTMLALEEARYLAATGRRTLFCCRSPLLADRVRPQLDETIDVHAIEPYTRELVRDAGMWADLPPASNADLRDLFVPQAACEAAIELGQAAGFDAIVIDEAQDLLNEVHLEFFDTLLKGGLVNGVWRFFLDHRQNVFASVDLKQLTRLENSAVSDYDLTENCRNTPEVAMITYMLAALEADDVLADAGAQVELRWTSDRSEEASTVSSVVAGWKRRGITADAIVILGPEALPLPELEAAVGRTGHRLTQFCNRRADEIGWCSIDEFKGLESSAVVVTGIRDLRSREARRRLYVACSRPRALLGLVLDIDLKPDFELRAAEFARMREEAFPGVADG